MTIEDTLNERQGTHGDYSVTASIAQDLKDALRARDGWALLSWRQREALDLICTKMARILSGNPSEPDHWRDIEGYAKLGGEAIGTDKFIGMLRALGTPSAPTEKKPRAQAAQCASSSTSGVRHSERTRRPSKR